MRLKYTLTCLLLPFFLSAQLHHFTSEGNLFNPRIIQTADGGYIMGSLEYCYTPGQWVIDGCTNALHLVRLNADEEVVWEKRYSFSGSGPLTISERADGSFTLVTSGNDSFECDGVFVALFGFYQIQIINISAEGEELGTQIFPETCEQRLVNSIELADDRLAMLSYYRKPGTADPSTDGRLTIMDHQGNIEKEIHFDEERFRNGRLFQLDNGNIALMYVYDLENIQLNYYDLDLNELNSYSTAALAPGLNLYFSYEFNVNLISDDEFAILIHARLTEEENNTAVYRLNAEATIQAEAFLDRTSPSNIVELDNFPPKTLLFMSTVPVNGDNNTQMIETTLDANAEIITIAYQSNSIDHAPEYILPYPEHDIAIVGQRYCCNFPEEVGPGQSFVRFGLLLTDAPEIPIPNKRVDIFPTVTDDVIYIQAKMDALHDTDLQLRIFSSSGKLMISRTLNSSSTEISMAQYPGGMYYLAIQEKDRMVKSGKIIKL